MVLLDLWIGSNLNEQFSNRRYLWTYLKRISGFTKYLKICEISLDRYFRMEAHKYFIMEALKLERIGN